MTEKPNFGGFARTQRQGAGFGLRQAAKELGVSAAYLSRVENDIDPASPKLMVGMSKLYKRPLEEFTARARGRLGLSGTAAHGLIVQSSAELRALYRMGSKLDPREIDRFLREILREKGYSAEDIERELVDLKSELPRIARGLRDDLFATRAKPRWLSRNRIAGMAYAVLARHGLGQKNYSPPTPVELIVEREPGIRYRIDENLACRKTGEPLVLGLSGWNGKAEREIIMSGALADSNQKCDEHRYNFTLAHEFFHAAEHLPLIPVTSAQRMGRVHVCDAVLDKPREKKMSAAEKAVHRWIAVDSGPRVLSTDEDWREWQANSFASALLMPEWAVAGELERRTGSQAILVAPEENPRESALKIAGQFIFGHTVYAESLAELFSVSRQAMAIRLLQLRLVRPGEQRDGDRS